MTREEVIEKVAAIICGQPSVVGGRSYAEARSRLDAKALDEAGLLVTPEVLRCVEACKKAADQTWFGPPAFAAERDCRDAGRAMLAKDDGPWRISYCRDGGVNSVGKQHEPDAWWVSHPSDPAQPWSGLRFNSEPDAIRACDALNAAWKSCEHDWSFAGGGSAHCRKCGLARP